MFKYFSRFCNLCESVETLDGKTGKHVQNLQKYQCNSTKLHQEYIIKVSISLEAKLYAKLEVLKLLHLYFSFELGAGWRIGKQPDLS